MTIITIGVIVSPDTMGTTTIQIQTDVRDALREIGAMGDDYNSVIERLIKEHNRQYLVEYSRKIVEERRDEFVSIDEL
jgi:predicted CopG family antitoxin